MFGPKPDPSQYRGTYLIQGLNLPRGGTGPLKVNPFSFGGGGSGLSQKTMEALSDLWDWEYMGAAEYEFGAAANALQAMVDFKKQGLLEARVVEIEGVEAIKSGNFSWYSRGQKRVKTSVFIIACKNHVANIVPTITSILTGDKIVNNRYVGATETEYPVSLKRGIRLWDALFSPDHYWGEDRKKFGGGLELDNGWLVFVNEAMFRNACTLFDIGIPDLTNAKRYVPPKALYSTDSVDKKILAAITAGTAKNFPDLARLIYDITTPIGEVVPDDQVPLGEQISKRISVLIRKKLLVRERKTGVISLAPKETTK